MRAGRFVCQPFCLSMCRITAKVRRFHWNLVLIGPTNQNWLTFGDDPSRILIPDHFSISLTIGESGILDLLAFLIIQSPADFHDTRRNGWRRQVHIILERYGRLRISLSVEVWPWGRDRRARGPCLPIIWLGHNAFPQYLALEFNILALN